MLNKIGHNRLSVHTPLAALPSPKIHAVYTIALVTSFHRALSRSSETSQLSTLPCKCRELSVHPLRHGPKARRSRITDTARSIAASNVSKSSSHRHSSKNQHSCAKCIPQLTYSLTYMPINVIHPSTHPLKLNHNSIHKALESVSMVESSP